MNEELTVSKMVIKRLPRYRRVLETLIKMNVNRVSSNNLGELTGYTASQIRQDLNNFGAFGTQGYGYNVHTLYDQIESILGVNKGYKVIIVGAGNLGQAIANHLFSNKSGYQIVGIFDINPRVIGLKINNVEVTDFEKIEEFLESNPVDIGVISTNQRSAQYVADEMVSGGVKGIWNFAAVDLNIPDETAIENVHMSDSLNVLTYYMNKNKKTQKNRWTQIIV